MRRAFTLIELMVVAAVITIVAALVGSVTIPLRQSAEEQALRERAKQVAEYEADAVIHGREADPNVRQRLLEGLSEAHISKTPRGPATVVAVTWKAASGDGRYLELVVFGGRR